MQKTMHILQLGPYPPPRGGVQTNMLAIQDELQKNGHQSSIISITKSERVGDEENVFHPRGSFDLLRLLLTLNYDLLHIHIGGILPVRVQLLIFVCALIAGGRSIMTFHSGGYPGSKEGKSAGYWTLRGLVFRRLTRIVVVNRLMIDMFERFGVKPERIQLVYPFALSRPEKGIEIPEKFRKFRKSHEKVLITVGLLEPDYDLDLQIDVMQKVAEKFPKTGLIIIGSGSLKPKLQNLIDSKSYARHILLAGDTDREVVLHLIEKADLMLRTTVFDGDAISVREALFLGTPVIATDNGMRPEGVTLIPNGDGRALEKAIAAELQENRKLEAASGDGHENIRKILEIYRELTSPGERQPENAEARN